MSEKFIAGVDIGGTWVRVAICTPELKEENINQTLINENLKNYAEKFNINLEQYKLYVEMADRISSRRQNANSFFLSINTAIVALVSYVQLGNSDSATFKLHWLIAISGIFVSYMWYRLIRSYRDLNSAKFKVIHHIEQILPLRPYDAEWAAVGRGKNPKLYLPFTHIEIGIPWVFFIIHLIVLIMAIPWDKIF